MPGFLWTVVPVRGYARGKSRLAAVLDPGARLRLNRRLLLATLRVIARWRGDLRRCVVVSPCPRALATARSEGAVALAEVPPRGLNQAAALGAAYARRHGARGILVLPCDLPGLTPAALKALARGARRLRQVAIAPDRKRSGTNALLLTAPGRFEFQFGADSFSRHELQAARRGYGVSICARAELAFDLDTPEDLAAWCKAGRARPGRRAPGDIVREKLDARARRRTKDDK